MDSASEDARHRAECRYWLDRGYTTRDLVTGLLSRITAKRGKAAAEKLRQGMREEWQRRNQK